MNVLNPAAILERVSLLMGKIGGSTRRVIRTCIFAGLTVLLLALAGVHSYRLSTTLTDGTVWVDVPSRVYLRGPTISLVQGTAGFPLAECKTPPQAGDLLLSVEGRKVTDFQGATEAFAASGDTSVSIEFYARESGKRHRCRLRAKQVSALELGDLPPSLLLWKVWKNGPADRAGLREGDVVLSIDGRGFAGTIIEAGPLVASAVLLNDLPLHLFMGSGSRVSYEAELLLQTVIGQEKVVFEVLRGEKATSFFLELERRRSPTTLIAFAVLLVFLAWQGYSASRASWSDRGGIVWQYYVMWSMAALYFLAIAATRIDVSYDLFASLRDWVGAAAFVGLTPLVFPGRSRVRRPSVLAILPVALSVTYYFWFWHSILPLAANGSSFSSLAGLRQKFFGEGGRFLTGDNVVPVLTLSVFIFALLYLFRYWRDILLPLSPRHPGNRQLCEAATSGDVKSLKGMLESESVVEGYFKERFTRLSRRLGKNPDDAAAERERLTLLEEDEGEVARALTPVEWCEFALPVLGFLGTVIGLARSLADIQTLNVGSEIAATEILRTLLSAFEGVGFAFDTTFLGLACMLVVAAVDTTVRRLTSRRLSEAGEVMAKGLASWATGSVIGQLALLDASLGGELIALNTSTSSELQRAQEHRQMVQSMVQQVLLAHPEPMLQEMKRILFHSVTMFHQLDPSPDRVLREWLSQEYRDAPWEYKALGLSQATPDKGLIVVGIPGRHLQVMGLSVTEALKEPMRWRLKSENLRAIYPKGDSDVVSLVTAEGRVLSGALKQGDGMDLDEFKQVSWLGEEGIGGPLGDADALLPLALNGEDHLLVARKSNNGFGLWCLRIGGEKAVQVGAFLHELSDESWALDRASRTVLRLGKKKGGGWIVQRQKVEMPTKRGGKEGAGKEKEEMKDAYWSHRSEPWRLIGVGEHRVVVAPEEGFPFYWDFYHGHFSRLHHSAWPSRARRAHLVAGADGWFAAFHGGSFRMWQVRPPGILVPYDDGGPLPVADFETEQVQATSDGRFLLAPKGNALATWRFPKYAIDVK